MFRWRRILKEQGILGMNARNLDYIMRYNHRNKAVVNDKLLTKHILEEHAIPSPPLYGCIRGHSDMHILDKVQAEHASFVIKPARGSGGNGIMLIRKSRTYKGETYYQRINGTVLSRPALEEYIRNIICGLYSKRGRSDKVLLEYMVEHDPVFKDISSKGVPDIRIIVFQGKAVMGMLRLPTRQSQGKANLHMGGVGVGVDMEKGVITHGIYHNKPVTHHPNTGNLLTGYTVPYWQEMREISEKLNAITGLDYLGIDFIIDKHYGPMVVEANASPGLAVQLANQKGLLSVLQAVAKD